MVDVLLLCTQAAACSYVIHYAVAAAGAILPRRDPVDRRLIEELKTRTGRIIDHPSDVGGWPQLRSATPPEDADRDGMPDQWESKHQLDPRKAADCRADADGDGFPATTFRFSGYSHNSVTR